MEEIINIENQNIINIKGGKKVVSSTPNQTIIETNESNLIVSGNNLNVKKIDIENNNIVIEGNILSIKFNKINEKKNFLKKIFK